MSQHPLAQLWHLIQFQVIVIHITMVSISIDFNGKPQNCGDT
jgi:hypothetical protein